MNVRRASSITSRSGVITRRIETRSWSRRISFIAIRLRTSRWTSSSTASPGSVTSSSAPASGRAAASSAPRAGKTFSSHHRATSGNDSRRSVSPVGAQSTITASKRASSWWRLICSRLNSSSRPGGTVSSSGDPVHAALDEHLAEPVLDRPPVAARAPPGRPPAAPTAAGPPASAGRRAPPRARRRGCARGRSTGRPRSPAAAQRRRRRPTSFRRRPCRCRGSCAAPWAAGSLFRSPTWTGAPRTA